MNPGKGLRLAACKLDDPWPRHTVHGGVDANVDSGVVWPIRQAVHWRMEPSWPYDPEESGYKIRGDE